MTQLTRKRVNAVAPGPVDTAQFRKECAENADQLWLDAQATYVLTRSRILVQLICVQDCVEKASTTGKRSQDYLVPSKRKLERKHYWTGS